MIFKSARLLMPLLFAATALPVMAEPLAVVNGQEIPSSRADAMIQQMTAQGQSDSPQLREAVKDKLINLEVLMQEADKQGLNNNEDVISKLKQARQSIIIGALIDGYLKKNPVSEAEIDAEYDNFRAQAGDKEYLARHILLDKEEDAKAIIAKLKTGAKFEDLAKQSKDPGGAANGGDLGWAMPVAFVKPFTDAMVALKKGETTEKPVKSQFGYHVIKLEDVRPARVPNLDEVKQQITESLQQKKLQAYQDDLRKKAKIQ